MQEVCCPVSYHLPVCLVCRYLVCRCLVLEPALKAAEKADPEKASEVLPPASAACYPVSEAYYQASAAEASVPAVLLF